MRYEIVLADPPWSFGAWSRPDAGRTAAAHYDTMTLEDLCAMGPWLRTITRDDSVLLMWSTCAGLPDALRVMDAWGFDYKTVAITWVKLVARTADADDERKTFAAGRAIVERRPRERHALHFGMGHYTRSQTELLLIGTRKARARHKRNVPQVLFAPVGQHSAKPREQYDIIDNLYPYTRKLELFARARQPGWDVWGDEAPESINV